MSKTKKYKGTVQRIAVGEEGENLLQIVQHTWVRKRRETLSVQIDRQLLVVNNYQRHAKPPNKAATPAPSTGNNAISTRTMPAPLSKGTKLGLAAVPSLFALPVPPPVS